MDLTTGNHRVNLWEIADCIVDSHMTEDSSTFMSYVGARCIALTLISHISFRPNFVVFVPPFSGLKAPFSSSELQSFMLESVVLDEKVNP